MSKENKKHYKQKKSAQVSAGITQTTTSSRLIQRYSDKILQNENKRLEKISKTNKPVPLGLMQVASDKTSYKDKIAVADKCLVDKSKRLQNYDYALVFPTSDAYERYLFRPKLFVEEKSNNFTHNVYMRKFYYTDQGRKVLYPIIYTMPTRETMEDMKNGKLAPDSISSSMTVNVMVNAGFKMTGPSKDIRYETEPVMLFRFDIYNGGASHNNRYREKQSNTKKARKELPEPKKLFDDEMVENTYKKYFKPNVPTPHFHFCSYQMTSMYHYTSGANAININDLIQYVEDLKRDDNPILNTNSFEMPFLSIKENEELYQLSKKEAKGYYAKLSQNDEFRKLLSTAFDKEGHFVTKNGLDAVLFDLKVINMLLEDQTFENINTAMEIAEKLATETGKHFIAEADREVVKKDKYIEVEEKQVEENRVQAEERHKIPQALEIIQPQREVEQDGLGL